LAPRDTVILCHQTLGILLKKGKIFTKGGGSRPKPSKKKNRRKTKTEGKLNRRNRQTTDQKNTGDKSCEL